MLTNRLLAVHCAVLDEGSVTSAAALLGFTVSAVSEQINRLEIETGCTLFERVGRGIRPTAAGLLLGEHARRILAEVSSAELALQDLREGRIGRLRVVSFYSAGESLLPPAIARFREKHPLVSVSPVVDDTEGALRRLRAGDVDLVLVVEPFAPGDEPQDDLNRVYLGSDEYRVILPGTHRLARHRSIDVADLAADDWIITSAAVGAVDYIRDATMACCRMAGFTPKIAAVADEFALVQGYVAAGLGVSFVPVLGLGAVRENVVVRRMKNPPGPRLIWVATRAGIDDEPTVVTMTAALKQVARSALRP